MNREEQLKQAIEEVVQKHPNVRCRLSYQHAIEETLSTPSILRHADPEIMKQAGWVREDEWISVEDSIPDYMDCVIIYTKQGIVTESQHCGDGLFVTGPYTFNNVTHWMPLPQPPKP